MINKGRYNHLYLYEVTEQDLLLPTEKASHYRAGNVLIFADKKTVDFGYELAKADDIATAREYLANSESFMYERIQNLRAQIEDLSTRIEQRDGLLRDISDDLRYERDTSAFLQKQLDEANYRLEIEMLSRNELVDDLQQVSVGTHAVEVALERTINEKEKLERELAARIADLIELDFQNDELKRQLEHNLAPTIAAAAQTGAAQTAAQAGAVQADAAQADVAQADVARDGSSQSIAVRTSEPADEATKNSGSDGQVLTVSSGKQVHVYHEFSAPPLRSTRARASLALRTFLRILGIVLIVAVVFVALSIVATAQFNHVSFGEALDLLLDMFWWIT